MIGSIIALNADRSMFVMRDEVNKLIVSEVMDGSYISIDQKFIGEIISRGEAQLRNMESGHPIRVCVQAVHCSLETARKFVPEMSYRGY